MFPLRHPATLAVLAAALCAAPAVPDEVWLRSGGRVSGVIVERTADAVVIETAPGRLALPMARVEKIVASRSSLEEYRARADALAPGDVRGWVELARWAADRSLLTPSREAWQRVLAAEPSHPEANAALGRVEVDGAWVTEEEAYRARGYVPHEGRWVTPAEHEALVRERAAEEASARQRREADLRVREAEARAREAEARAREAESAAGATTEEGIPLWWGWGGPGLLPPGVRPPGGPGDAPSPPQPPPAPPPSSTPPSSIGPMPPSAPPPAAGPANPAPRPGPGAPGAPKPRGD